MKKILIISTNAIGDAYLSMSAVEPLKLIYPQVEFYFIFPENARLLELNLQNNFFFFFVEKNYKSLLNIVHKMLFVKFDRVFSFFPGVFNSIVFSLVRSEMKIGQINFTKKNRWDDKDAYLTVRCNHFKEKKIFLTKTNNYLLRISIALRIADGISTEIQKYRPTNLCVNYTSFNRILIHYKSNDSERSLTFALLSNLIQYLSKEFHCEIFIVGVKEDIFTIKNSKRLNKLVKYLVSPGLDTLIQEINESFFIGVDSFPIHIADAYNTNFMGLFTSTNPKVVLVNSEKSILFSHDSFLDVSESEFIYKVKQVFSNIK